MEGLAADVTIDKNTYELGKDIPLHLAVENFFGERTNLWCESRV